jgi:hypothetical protein
MYWRSSNSGSSERRNSQPNHDRNTKKKRRNIVIAPFAHGLSPNRRPSMLRQRLTLCYLPRLTPPLP